MATKQETLTIRVTKEFKREIERMALKEDRSVSNVANRLLTLGLLEEMGKR